MKFSKYLAVAVLLGASVVANATQYQFTYSFSDGKTSMSGLFDGTADGDTIYIQNFESISFTSPLHSETSSQSLSLNSLSSFGAQTSFSGKTQDFATGYTNAAAAESWSLSAFTVRGIDSIGMTRFWSDSTYHVDEDFPINSTWSVSAVTPSCVSAVPEPATYGMSLAGLGIVGWLARRRHAA